MPIIPKCLTLQRGNYDAKIRKGNEVVVSDALKAIYGTKILPLEKHYNYENYSSTPLEPAYFESKPLVLLFGEYSTGKTSFIKYILGKEYPGMRIGPEPTTDNFIVVEYGDDEGIVPGNAAVVDKSKQFGTLAKFGGQFLNRFQCVTVKSEILEKVTLVDTPGILSGEKERGYDLTAVLRWFAERCDRIILLFDINKLDISDELKAAIDMVKGYEDKIRIVLNKSDTVNTQQLMRVYGALMWSLGKVLATPEAARVYIGSFWENFWRHEENRTLFEDEEADLIIDIYNLSRDADLRKLNDLVRRAKRVRIHAHLMAELRRRMPVFGIGASRKKKVLLRDLALICEKLAKDFQIPAGDFPNVKELRRYFNDISFRGIKPKKQKYFDRLDEVLNQDIGRLVPLLPVQDKEENASERALKRQLILSKVWTERMLMRRPIRHRGISLHTVSSEKLSDTSGVESDHHGYQKISSRTVGLRTPVVITREDLSSGASSSSGISTLRKQQTLTSPLIETSRTIVTRTESSTTLPSGARTITTETTLKTPEICKVKTCDETAAVADAKPVELKENVEVKPIDPHLASYREYQEPKIEALYATIGKRNKSKNNQPQPQPQSQPQQEEEKEKEKEEKKEEKEEKKKEEKEEEKEEKKEEKKDGDGETVSIVETRKSVDDAEATFSHQSANESPKLEELQKISETTTTTTTTLTVATENTEVTVEEQNRMIATTANGLSVQFHDDDDDDDDHDDDDEARETASDESCTEKLPLNILETGAEEESKILNVSPPETGSLLSRDEKRRKFLFGDVDKAEPSVIIKEMTESYDQSSIKNYDEIINSDR